MVVSACTPDLKTWKEEVKLSDGRVIVVTQKRRCEGNCIERETWLTVKLPETGNKEVTWNEKLAPMLLNVYQGSAYIVGTPPTYYEYRLYDNPEPYYLTYRWEGDQWKRIPITELPKAIYDANQVIDGGLVKVKFLSVAEKESRAYNGNFSYWIVPDVLRVNPRYTSPFAENAKFEKCTWDATKTICTQSK